MHNCSKQAKDSTTVSLIVITVSFIFTINSQPWWLQSRFQIRGMRKHAAQSMISTTASTHVASGANAVGRLICNTDLMQQLVILCGMLRR
jgi:hypothetical protein